MSRPLPFALLGTAVVVCAAGAVWWGASTQQAPSPGPLPSTVQEPVREVSAPPPAAVPPEPRSSASFAPMPEGLDMRQLRPQMRDADAVRRLHQRVADAGLTVEAMGAPEEVEQDIVGWSTDEEGIDSAVAELRGEMFECMHGYGEQVGGYEGVVTLEFDVSAAEVEDGVAYPQNMIVVGEGDVPQAIQSCMSSVYSNMTFEPPETGVTQVAYPIVLSFEQ